MLHPLFCLRFSGYVLLYLLKGSLPWQGLKAANKKEKYNKIRDKKLMVVVGELCNDLPDEFDKYVTYTRTLKFAEKPNYTYMRGLFRDLFVREGYVYDYQYDWTIADDDDEAADNGGEGGAGVDGDDAAAEGADGGDAADGAADGGAGDAAGGDDAEEAGAGNSGDDGDGAADDAADTRQNRVNRSGYNRSTRVSGSRGDEPRRSTRLSRTGGRSRGDHP